MRIVYLHQYFNSPKQAGSTRSYEMGRRLAAKGHQVHLITSERTSTRSSRGWRQEWIDGMMVHWLHVPYSNHMPYARRMVAFLQFAFGAGWRAAALPADVVFATSTPLTIALPGIFAAKRNRTPLVFEVRDLWPEEAIAMGAVRGRLPIALANALERFAYRHSAQIVALSPDMREGVVRCGYARDRVHVIPNASDLDLFDVPDEAGWAFRRRHDWLQQRPLVVYTGAMGRRNGVSYLVHMAARVREIDPEVRFLLVGEGYEEQMIRQLAARLGVLDQTLFMLPALPKSQMPAILSAATLAASVMIDLQALWPNSANKVFDAFAAGRPVAINHEGWLAQVLRENGAGIVLPAGDTEAAAQQVAAYLADAEGVRRGGQNAKQLAVTRFDRDQLAVQLEGVLFQALGEAR